MKKEDSMRCCPLFYLSIQSWIHGVDIFLIETLPQQLQRFTEASNLSNRPQTLGVQAFAAHLTELNAQNKGGTFY